MKISWKIDFIRSIKLLLYISIHFLNARSLFLPPSPLVSSNISASRLCTILVYFLLFNIHRWLLPTKNLVVFYLNINAYIPHIQSRNKKSIRKSKNKDQKEMINSKKERKSTHPRAHTKTNFWVAKTPVDMLNMKCAHCMELLRWSNLKTVTNHYMTVFELIMKLCILISSWTFIPFVSICGIWCCSIFFLFHCLILCRNWYWILHVENKMPTVWINKPVA